MHRSGGRAPGSDNAYAPAGTPWWNFPTGIGGRPRVQNTPGHCWGDVQVAPNGELYATPVACGPFPPGSHLGSGDSGEPNP